MAIAEKTGWPLERILDTPFLSLNLMLTDAPRLVRQKEEAQTLTTDKELEAFFGVKVE